jgi:restriction system protein
MARRKNNILEDIIEISSKLPWWVCVVLAVIAYAVLHLFAANSVAPITGPGQMGDFAAKSLLRTFAMFGQIILPFAFLIAALVSFINARKQRQLFENAAAAQKVNALGDMSWREFEMMVGEFFRRRGFNVTLTGDGVDGGVDIVLKKGSEKYFVQCKQWKAYKVGAPTVRELYGVMASEGATGGYFVTSGEYTSDARKFADGKNIRLIDGKKLMDMIREVQRPHSSEIEKESIVSSNVEPDCPKCGARMIKRVARQGKNAGKEFWGCSAYPRCTGARSVML